MSFLDLFQSVEKTVGLAAFDHPTVHNQLTSGPGAGGLSQASKGLANDIATRLENMDANLKRALATSQGAWTGHASESASESTTPLTKAVRSSREISMEIGKQVDHQTEHFSKVKNMPPPKKVDPIDLGIGGYTPGGFLAEQIDKEIQERQANAVEEQARQQYMTYQESTKSTTGNLTRFSPVPNPLTTLEVADTRPPEKVDPNIGTLSKTDSGQSDNGESNTDTHTGPDTDSGPTNPGPFPPSPIPDPGPEPNPGPFPPSPIPDPGPPYPSPFPPDPPPEEDPPPPDETDSDSAKPAPTPAPPTPGPGSGGGGLAGGGVIGGAIGGAALSGGGQAGSPSAGGRALGAGGSSGIGGTGSGTGSGNTAAGGATGARGATGAGAMGAGAGQRGKGSEEDEEHERKYVEDTDEPFEFDDEVDPDTGYLVAPPVIGEHRPPSHGQR